MTVRLPTNFGSFTDDREDFADEVGHPERAVNDRLQSSLLNIRDIDRAAPPKYIFSVNANVDSLVPVDLLALIGRIPTGRTLRDDPKLQGGTGRSLKAASMAMGCSKGKNLPNAHGLIDSFVSHSHAHPRPAPTAMPPASSSGGLGSGSGDHISILCNSHPDLRKERSPMYHRQRRLAGLRLRASTCRGWVMATPLRWIEAWRFWMETAQHALRMSNLPLEPPYLISSSLSRKAHNLAPLSSTSSPLSELVVINDDYDTTSTFNMAMNESQQGMVYDYPASHSAGLATNATDCASAYLNYENRASTSSGEKYKFITFAISLLTACELSFHPRSRSLLRYQDKQGQKRFKGRRSGRLVKATLTLPSLENASYSIEDGKTDFDSRAFVAADGVDEDSTATNVVVAASVGVSGRELEKIAPPRPGPALGVERKGCRRSGWKTTKRAKLGGVPE
ncbi:hypothetical protein GALMADRAFT_1340416 [Galerina marginata CBS 339.88]|uniref:Uncharacterized protein n=1 Tax=Galerina marginata (strain CBS 339.88) TaxID=685588 RepID=A0A067TLU1_GALM3|nr:hypothetical protein GALMADRAFT_1340416 [Galerina marginata CBS 339.88]